MYKTILAIVSLFALASSVPVSDVEPIHVSAYIESLCPDSKRFITTQLYPTYQKFASSNPPVLTVNLVTYGNEIIGFNKTSPKQPAVLTQCQHGEPECLGNLIQSCAVVKLPLSKSLPLVNCMFSSKNWKTPEVSGKECAQELEIDFDDLNSCANSLEGTALEYFMGAQTNSLKPPHNYVPWVTINNKHSADIQKKAESHLAKLVCDSYSGKSDLCNSV